MHKHRSGGFQTLARESELFINANAQYGEGALLQDTARACAGVEEVEEKRALVLQGSQSNRTRRRQLLPVPLLRDRHLAKRTYVRVCTIVRCSKSSHEGPPVSRALVHAHEISR